jgi:hypothetical protein
VFAGHAANFQYGFHAYSSRFFAGISKLQPRLALTGRVSQNPSDFGKAFLAKLPDHTFLQHRFKAPGRKTALKSGAVPKPGWLWNSLKPLPVPGRVQTVPPPEGPDVPG